MKKLAKAFENALDKIADRRDSKRIDRRIKEAKKWGRSFYLGYVSVQAYRY